MNWIRKNSAGIAVALLIFGTPVPAVAGQLDEKLSALSRSGNGEAAYHLGMLYHMGLAGVPKDQRKAFELFRLSAERGDPLGAYKYGCYFDGQGGEIVKSDAKLALKWKLVAAEAGYSLAQQDVGRHLVDEGDASGAVKWFEAAAAQGDRMALGFLGASYSGELPPELAVLKVPRDPVKGWAYLLLSARDIPQMQTDLEASLSKASVDVQKRVKEFVSNWRAKPTALSRSLGIDAAYKLAGLPVPKS